MLDQPWMPVSAVPLSQSASILRVVWFPITAASYGPEAPWQRTPRALITSPLAARRPTARSVPSHTESATATASWVPVVSVSPTTSPSVGVLLALLVQSAANPVTRGKASSQTRAPTTNDPAGHGELA